MSEQFKPSSLRDFLDVFAILNIRFIPVIETPEETEPAESWWIAEGAGSEDIAFIFDAETEEFLRWSASTKD